VKWLCFRVGFRDTAFSHHARDDQVAWTLEAGAIEMSACISLRAKCDANARAGQVGRKLRLRARAQRRWKRSLLRDGTNFLTGVAASKYDELWTSGGKFRVEPYRGAERGQWHVRRSASEPSSMRPGKASKRANCSAMTSGE